MKYHKLFYNPTAVTMDTKKEFDDSFKAKYGKTYIEAEDDIRDAMFPRVCRLLHLAPSKPLDILDFGTAYGTFLVSLLPEWRGYGVEKIPGIVKAAQKLGRDVYHLKDLYDLALEKGPFDAVTAWNVIEHIDDVGAFIYAAKSMVKKGGLLCISTPNAAGGYFRFRRAEYETEDAGDHFWHFTPRTLRGILEDAGFAVVQTVITGHHPERWRGTMFLSKLFGLGDTFEMYARRRT